MLADELEMFVLVELLLEGKRTNVSSMFPSLITVITAAESLQRETTTTTVLETTAAV